MSESNVNSTTDLPHGWIFVALRELLYEIEAGKSFDCEPRPATADEWGVIKVSAMTWGQFDEHENKAVSPGRHFNPANEIRQNDLLVSRSNTAGLVGASVLVGRCRPHLLLSDKSMRLKYAPSICAAWLHGALSSPHSRQQMSLLATGTSDSMRNISQEKLSGIVLRLPPALEQQRIVDEVDELFSDLDAGVAALERVRAKLKLYRAAVLKAAVEGALTAEWRAQHPHTEPASALLGRILAERRLRWEEDQLAKFKAKGQERPKNWKAKYKEPVVPDTVNLPPLPEGWCWTSVEQLGEVRLGRQRAPQHHRGDHMRPYLRVANVYEDRLDLRDVKRMNFTPEEFTTYALRYGDVLLNEGQSAELVGRPALYRDEIPGCCYQKTLLRFRAYRGVLPEFALSVFRAYLHNGRFRKSANITTSIAHLAAERFVSIEFPLPPVAEQEAIVEAVEDQLSVIDHLEADLDAELKSAQGLRQAILRHAFTGQLVPQDPNDEPASELLRRIAAERNSRETSIRRRRTTAS